MLTIPPVFKALPYFVARPEVLATLKYIVNPMVLYAITLGKDACLSQVLSSETDASETNIASSPVLVN